MCEKKSIACMQWHKRLLRFLKSSTATFLATFSIKVGVTVTATIAVIVRELRMFVRIVWGTLKHCSDVLAMSHVCHAIRTDSISGTEKTAVFSRS